MHRFLHSELFKLIQEFGGLSLKRLVYVAALVGLTSTLLIALINFAAHEVADKKSVTLVFFIFVPLLVSYVVLMRINNTENISSTQLVVHRFRMHVMSQALKADLLTLDDIDRSYILTTLSRDAQSIAMGVMMLVPLLQSAAMVFFAISYLFVISLPAALATLVFGVIVVIVSANHMKAKHQALEVAWSEEAKAAGQIAEFLAGFKEIKMNSARALDFSKDLISTSRLVTKTKTEAMIGLANHFSTIQVVIYALVGVMIFIVPMLSDSFYSQVISVSTTVLFVAGSLTGLIQTIPAISQANTAADEIARLNKKLEGIPRRSEDAAIVDVEPLSSIRLEAVTHRFKSQTSSRQFIFGPVSYEFKAGKVYFVRGSNGSGKTSLMRLLTGLVPIETGHIFINDRLVIASESQSYRDQFSTIFNDFHLFRKLYGLYQASDEEVNVWLEKLELQDKVSCERGSFTNLNLSTGQKKRVALVVAMLEQRPIIILDEWASDQDPEFRRFFYEQIIPELRALNKLVIAITHDDSYFDHSDHLLIVDNGRLYEDR